MRDWFNKEKACAALAALLALAAAARVLGGVALRAPPPEVPPPLAASGSPGGGAAGASAPVFPRWPPAAGRDIFQRSEAWEDLEAPPLAAPALPAIPRGYPVPTLDPGAPFPGVAESP